MDKIAYNRQWRAKNQEKLKEQRKRWWAGTGKRNRRLKLYGVSESEYQEMLNRQSGRCAICKIEAPLNVDHNHNTQRARGLLCINCNHGLGKFMDNPELLRFAALYLEENHD